MFTVVMLLLSNGNGRALNGSMILYFMIRDVRFALYIFERAVTFSDAGIVLFKPFSSFQALEYLLGR